MMTLKFDHTSWHYKIAKFGSLRTSDRQTDMCHYVRSFIWGAMLGLIIAFAVLMFTVMQGVFIGQFVAAIVTGYWALSGAAAFGAIINGLALALGTMIAAFVYKEKRDEKLYPYGKPSKPDGFIKNAYNGWKDKYCARIEISPTEDEQHRIDYYAAQEARYEAERARDAAMAPVLDEIIQDLETPDESQPKP